MTTAVAAPDNNNADLKALAQEIAGLIQDNKVATAVQKFQAASNDKQYAILMDRDARVLYAAAYTGHMNTIATLLNELSTDQRVTAITVQDMFGSTPLHWAAYNGRINATTTILARLNPAQCRDALFNLEYGVGTKLAKDYANNPQHPDAQRYLNTLIEGIVPLIPFGNDKKGLITGILEEVGKINRHAEIPSVAVPYLYTPKTVGDYFQSSFAQAATTTTDPANVPGNDNTSAVGEEKPGVATTAGAAGNTPTPGGQS